jgi:hypothetical protein
VQAVRSWNNLQLITQHCWLLKGHGGHLDEPHDVVGVQLVLADPGGQDVPLHALAAVDADAQLRVLILAGLRGVSRREVSAPLVGTRIERCRHMQPQLGQQGMWMSAAGSCSRHPGEQVTL